MENILNSNNLIEIDEALTKFKERHKREAAKEVAIEIAKAFQVNQKPRNGNIETAHYTNYDNAVRDVLNFIGNNFVLKKTE